MSNEQTASATKEATGAVPGTNGSAPSTQPPVQVNTTELKSSYCNVCNASSTREEMILTFGSNHDWDLEQKMREVKLHHRIILSPFAAKRLQELLTKLIRDHEARFGELK